MTDEPGSGEYPPVGGTPRSQEDTAARWQRQFQWSTLQPASYWLVDFDRVVKGKIQERSKDLRAEVLRSNRSDEGES